jgi:cytochrome c-type biogenesis protein CcmH
MKRILGRFILPLVMAGLLAVSSVSAMTPDERLPDPVMEERARVLSKNIRCMVCAGQSIDDSEAHLAKDLRRLVRERIVAGDDDQAIYAFLQARYGDEVLFTPPLQTRTILLFLAPFLLVGIAVMMVMRTVRAGQKAGGGR